jgi:hypothetical protein
MMICGAKFYRYLHADVYSIEWSGSVSEADDGSGEWFASNSVGDAHPTTTTKAICRIESGMTPLRI